MTHTPGSGDFVSSSVLSVSHRGHIGNFSVIISNLPVCQHWPPFLLFVSSTVVFQPDREAPGYNDRSSQARWESLHLLPSCTSSPPGPTQDLTKALTCLERRPDQTAD